MILILSDGGKKIAEIEKQLKLHNDKYVFMFSDFIAASRFGRGNVIIGKPSKREIERAYMENKIDSVIDATEKPVSKMSQAALSACDGKIKYVKLVKCKEYDGAETILSYKMIGDKVKAIKKNTLIYGTPAVTKAISSWAGEGEDKIFVTVRKSPVFDVEKALEYSIPLLNIKEFETFTKTDEIKIAIEKLSIGQVVFTEETATDELIGAAKEMNVKAYVTHSAGVEYPYCVNNMRDALILIHSNR